MAREPWEQEREVAGSIACIQEAAKDAGTHRAGLIVPYLFSLGLLPIYF